MNIHKKLMQARVKLLETKLEKTGHNKFAGYKYFELSDFLPQTQIIFNEIGLCGYISYSNEYATLTIRDMEDDTGIIITSPMATASLKGAHDIQNLGAVETYQRRYLWMTAMELTESDPIDSSPPVEPPKEVKPAPKVEKTIPKVIEGKEKRDWYLKINAEVDADPIAWCDLVDEATKISLGVTQDEEDVMKLFTNNRNIFDLLKANDAEKYTNLMLAFKTRKEMLKG
jgi:hypothetical protein